MVDAIIPIGNYGNNETFYVFSGTQYTRYKFTPSVEHVLGPHDIRVWKTFKEADWGAVDAVVPVPGKTNEFYAFLGGHYFRFIIDESDHMNDSMQYSGVKTIASEWKGVVDAGFDTIDAGIAHPTNGDIMYFFSGTKCLKYSWSKDNVIWNKTIAEGWPGIGKAGFDSVDAIFTAAGTTNHYFVFQGDKVAKIDWDGSSKDDTLEWGPHSIKDQEAGSWSALAKWV